MTETSLECVVDGVEVDLMVSPHWPVPANFYTFLTTVKPQNRSKYETSLHRDLFQGLLFHLVYFLKGFSSVPASGRFNSSSSNQIRSVLSANRKSLSFASLSLSLLQDYRQEFISRALAWREQKWSRSSSGQGRPSTYLLSLLVLKAHEDATRRLGVFSSLSPDTMAHQ